MEIGKTKVAPFFCCTPTLWGLSSLICKMNSSCGFTLGIVTVLILSAALVIILASVPSDKAKFALGFSISVALLVSPYLWTYSQTALLLPILICLVILERRRLPYMLVAPFTLYIAFFSSMIVFLSIVIGEDVLSSLVPLAVLTIIFVLYRRDHPKPQQSQIN
jgi:hypothetical protein